MYIMGFCVTNFVIAPFFDSGTGWSPHPSTRWRELTAHYEKCPKREIKQSEIKEEENELFPQVIKCTFSSSSSHNRKNSFRKRESADEEERTNER